MKHLLIALLLLVCISASARRPQSDVMSRAQTEQAAQTAAPVELGK